MDGHRMNDNLYGSALIGTEAAIDVDLIDRVEVIRGPSASIYGYSAFFGVINVITRKAAQINGLEVSAEGGSYDSYKGRFTYGKQFKNELELVLSGSIYDSAGQKRLFFKEFDNAQNNYGVAQNADAEYSRKFSGSLAYHDFTLSGAYSLRDKAVPTASFGTVFNDGRQKTEDETTYADVKYQHTFAGDLEVMGRAFYDRYAYRATSPYNYGTSADPFIVVNRDDNYGDAVGAEIQVTERLFDRHTIVLGSEYREDLNLYQSNYQADSGKYNFRDNRQGRSAGFFAQDEFALCTNLLFDAGLRYDYHATFGGALNPRLGLIYSPWQTTTFKALYGQAYRAPNAYELYDASPGYSKANSDLKAGTIRTYELVYEQILPQNLRLSVSGYYNEISELISQETDSADGLLVFENEKKVTAKGLELELEGRYAHGLRARASYALQRADDGDTGVELNNSPRHLAKLNLTLPLYRENLYAGLELQYVSSLRTLADKRTSGFLVANATLFSQRLLLENLEISASIYNLSDTKYSYPGTTGTFEDTIPQDGRSFRVKLTYKF